MPPKETIYILTEERGRQITGGQKYNQIFFKEMDIISTSVKYLTDDNFPKIRIPILYNFIYLRLLFIKDMKFLLLDSRMYTRSVLIILLLRLLRSNLHIVCIHHHFNYMARTPIFLRPFDWLLEHCFLYSAHEIIVPSPYTRDICFRKGLNKKTIYIPIGFNKIVNNERITPRLGASYNLLYLGSVNKRKGTDLLVKSASFLKGINYTLNIAGSYKNDRFYRRLIRHIRKRDLESKIIFHGRIDVQKVPDFFHRADCFLLPSRYEGFGMVIAEAFSYGIPVVAFNTSSMHYLVENMKNGMLVEKWDVKKYAEAIVEITGNKSALKEMQKNAMETFHKLPSMDEMIFAMRDFIKKINE